MRRIHGLPGTTFSNPTERGKYPSEARASMTMAELECWIALEIAGRYHRRVHRGVHAIPADLWRSATRNRRPRLIPDAERFVIDFLPADTRRVGANGFQVGRIRYWDPLLARVFPTGSQVLVRYDPTDLSRVYVPSPADAEYLRIPYADPRRPPNTLAELERARVALAAKGNPRPSKDQIFAATDAQREIEEQALRRSRSARRNKARRPIASPREKAKPNAHVDYSKRVIPYAGEQW